MSLTVHYIDDNYEIKSRCLQTAYFPENHTGENIAQGLKEALASWGLCEDQQVSITTDNGSNIVKAVTLNNWTRLQCFGHRLHLAIGKLVFIVHIFILYILRILGHFVGRIFLLRNKLCNDV